MNVILWFLWRRWKFTGYILALTRHGYQPGRETVVLLACHNTNLYGCRKHPVIYNDMCRIVRGVK